VRRALVAQHRLQGDHRCSFLGSLLRRPHRHRGGAQRLRGLLRAHRPQTPRHPLRQLHTPAPGRCVTGQGLPVALRRQLDIRQVRRAEPAATLTDRIPILPDHAVPFPAANVSLVPRADP
jgi:hypothetical protein